MVAVMSNAFSTVKSTLQHMLQSMLVAISLLALLLPLAACDELAAPDLTSVTGSTLVSGESPAFLPAGTYEVKLKLGGVANLRGDRGLIFDALGPDSRCPINVACLHGGAVEADFTVEKGGGKFKVNFVLPGGDPSALPLHRAPWVSVDGVIIYLVRLDPYPVVEVNALQGAIVRDAGPPTATLFVRPCPTTERRCASGGGNGGSVIDKD